MKIRIYEGDTDPLLLTIGAWRNGAPLPNLDELVQAELYLRRIGAATNHVDGAALDVHDSAELQLRFEPTGNGPGGADAFQKGSAGHVRGYVKATWLDGKETRHGESPQGEPLAIEIVANLEP